MKLLIMPLVLDIYRRRLETLDIYCRASHLLLISDIHARAFDGFFGLRLRQVGPARFARRHDAPFSFFMISNDAHILFFIFSPMRASA